MRHKHKDRFDTIYLYNRWMRCKYSRSGDWTIFGIHVWWSGPLAYTYKFCLFGLEAHIWFKRVYL